MPGGGKHQRVDAIDVAREMSSGRTVAVVAFPVMRVPQTNLVATILRTPATRIMQRPPDHAVPPNARSAAETTLVAARRSGQANGPGDHHGLVRGHRRLVCCRLDVSLAKVRACETRGDPLRAVPDRHCRGLSRFHILFWKRGGMEPGNRRGIGIRCHGMPGHESACCADGWIRTAWRLGPVA
jgi:hypothetical protein